ncbi:MAG: hypothetical protein HRT71_06245, partial [Flavobacteriales bacterium]|nr:hypothetical protein [Flavobacteriales bacterium]
MKGFHSRVLTALIGFVLLLSSASSVFSQNTYAYVTSVAGNVVTTGAGYSLAGFIVGDRAMIMQMKGANVFEKNEDGYGAITAYNQAGAYDVGFVTAVGANSVTLSINVDAYDINSNVQLISMPPDDGGGNYTEDGSNLPQEWDGYTGGVYAVSICGTYNLTGDLGLTAENGSEGGGFRGAPINLAGGYYGGFPRQWVAIDEFDVEFGSFKGEGIASTYCQSGGDPGPGVVVGLDYDRVDGDYSSGGWAFNYVDYEPDGMGGAKSIDEICSIHDFGSGALANGGGAGVKVDGGGGGGGNGGAGGLGGCGWMLNYDCDMNDPAYCGAGSPCQAPPPLALTDVQGGGGYNLTIPTDGSRLFLGGGGGSAWTDDEIGDEGELPMFDAGGGMHGGMIYFVQAADVQGNGFNISADGRNHVREINWQANGGGGAGG